MEHKKQIDIKNAVLFLLTFLKPFKKYFVAGMFGVFIVGGISMLTPLVVGQIVDESVGNDENLFLKKVNDSMLLLIGIIICHNLFTFVQRYLFNKMNELTKAFLQKELYIRYLKYPVSFFDKERIGELLSRINSDIGMVQYIFSDQIPAFLYHSVALVVALILLFLINIKLAAITIISFPIAVYFSIIIGKRVRKLSKSIQDSYAESFIYVEETLQKVRTVKAFNNQNAEHKKYRSILDRIINESVRKGIFTTGLDSLGSVLTGIAQVLIFWYGTTLIGEGEITIGNLITFFLVSFLLGESVARISGAYGNLQNVLGAVDRIHELAHTKTEDGEFVAEYSNADLKQSLTLKNLSFTYRDDSIDFVLKELNVEIRKGQKIGIVGESGAGKSTLMQLILRFYNPSMGGIYLDGININKYSLEDYRSLFGVVSQEIELFGGTVKENIGYGVKDATIDEIIEAAKKANAYSFIVNLPNGFETLVGENGIMLSGGQRQRIAIARALLVNPKVLLLDEATSAMDSKTESLIKDALEKLMQNRTSIIVAHRLDTVMDADKILVMDKGQIIESGKHKDLIQNQSGVYKKMVEKQMGDRFSGI